MFERYFSKDKSVENRWYGITAYYSNIPIQYLEQFRQAYPGAYKIRYRGPRKGDGRSKSLQQTTCLKSNAKTFSAYRY